jgi:hypothetical protein
MEKTIEDYAIAAMPELINLIDVLHPERRWIQSSREGATHFTYGTETKPTIITTPSGDIGEQLNKHAKYYTEAPREQRVAIQAFKYAQAMMGHMQMTNMSRKSMLKK